MFENQVPATDRQWIHRAVRLAGGSAWAENQQTRKNGWTKWVPAQYRKVDPLATWAIVRQGLRIAGVQPDPPVSPRPAYCSAKRPPGVS
jgi:hypothetical protein